MNGVGRELTHRGLAQRLGGYGIKSHNIRIQGFVVKGYEREDLNDAWTRYLGVADAADQNNERKTINTEEVIKEEGPFADPGKPSSRPPQESATSATGATPVLGIHAGQRLAPLACGLWNHSNLATAPNAEGTAHEPPRQSGRRPIPRTGTSRSCLRRQGRPGLAKSPYANPFPVKVHGLTESLRLYRQHIEQFDPAALRRDLTGRDLACWCPLGQPYHADVLLELAYR